ncbi:hypothetical protein CEXT_788781, partial [Caerostris extrusa]
MSYTMQSPKSIFSGSLLTYKEGSKTPPPKLEVPGIWQVELLRTSHRPREVASCFLEQANLRALNMDALRRH